jgi:transcriptional regulator with XRE-family HTH domain
MGASMQGTATKSETPVPADMPAWAVRLRLHEPPALGSQWIRRLRKAMGITQEALAEGLDVDIPTVWRWESGEFQPKLDTVTRLLVFELRHMGKNDPLPFEDTLLYQLITTEGVLRDMPTYLSKNGRPYRYPERRQALEVMIRGLQAILDSEPATP